MNIMDYGTNIWDGMKIGQLCEANARETFANRKDTSRFFCPGIVMKEVFLIEAIFWIRKIVAILK